jgi:hypothetical protein
MSEPKYVKVHRLALRGYWAQLVETLLLEMTPLEAAEAAIRCYDMLPDSMKPQLLRAIEERKDFFFVVDASNRVVFEYDNRQDAEKRADKDTSLRVVPGGSTDGS